MAQVKGQFSRRHKSSEAHRKSVNEYVARRDYRTVGALERQAAAAKRSPEEQLQQLDQRLGKNKGAKRERARLKLAIEGRKNKKTRK